MKLARVRMFLAEVAAHTEIQTHCASTNFISIYYPFRGRWFDLAGKAVSEDSLSGNLELVKSLGKAWRQQKSSLTYFPIKALDSVLVLNFLSAPKKTTRDHIEKLLQKCLQHSNHAYGVQYDALTQLLSKLGFEEACDREFAALISAPQNTETASVIDQNSLAVIALDIDYFKQINDSYGHSYGNVVLQCVARRIEKECRGATEQASGKLTLLPARPSGEEFLVFASGPNLATDLPNIADRLRRAISDIPLPDDTETGPNGEGELPEGLEMPALRDRNVAVSVGVSTAMVPIHDSIPKQVRERLQREADTAMYRAKSAGRNRCVLFPEILMQHGRVLEHNLETGIVTIDLGRQVGVHAGHEFSVYHPKFSGQEPFVISDGRTQRKLGTYPKVASGRIEVFEVQAEISFCFTSENKGSSPFPAGSAIELIPAGSITHLLQDAVDRYRFGPIPLAQPADLDQKSKKIVSEGGVPHCLVIAIGNADALIDSRGIAFVNRILASIYNVIRQNGHSSCTIGKTGTFELSAVCSQPIFSTGTSIQNLVETVRQDFANLPELTVGIFEKGDLEYSEDGDQSKLSGNFALEYARIAASIERSIPIAIVRFTPNVAMSLLSQSRTRLSP